MTKWQQLKLGEIATFVNGYAFKPSDWNDTGIPIIRIQNLTNDNASRNYYNGQLDEKYRVVRGDILISWSATIGVFEWTREDSYLNQHIFKVVFNKLKVNKSFFKYLIKQKINEMLAKVHGSTMKHITKSNFDNIPILLPDINEQDRIARILDKAEEIRTKKKLANEKLDEFLKSTFIDMFGDPVTKPKGYNIELIKNIGTVITGNTPPRTNEEYYGNYIEWIKSDNINTPYTYLTKAEEYLSELGMQKGRVVPKNSILVTCIAGSFNCIGNVALTDRPVAFNQQINAIIPEKKYINSAFLYEQLYIGKKLIQEKSTNSMKGMVSKSKFETIKLILPDLKEQELFEKIFIEVEKQKEKNQKVIEQMDNLFNSLMQQAFKGKI